MARLKPEQPMASAEELALIVQEVNLRQSGDNAAADQLVAAGTTVHGGRTHSRSGQGLIEGRNHGNRTHGLRRKGLGALAAVTLLPAAAVGVANLPSEEASANDQAGTPQEQVDSNQNLDPQPPSFSPYSLAEISQARHGAKDEAPDLRNVESAELKKHGQFAQNMAVDGAEKFHKGQLFEAFGYDNPKSNSKDAGAHWAEIAGSEDYISGKLVHDERVISSNATKDGHVEAFHTILRKGRYVGGARVSRIETDKHGVLTAYIQAGDNQEVKAPKTDVIVSVDTDGDKRADALIDATNDLGYNTDDDFSPEKGRFAWIKKEFSKFVCKCACKVHGVSAPEAPGLTVTGPGPRGVVDHPRVNHPGPRVGTPNHPKRHKKVRRNPRPQNPVVTQNPPEEHHLQRHTHGDGPHGASLTEAESNIQADSDGFEQGHGEGIDSHEHGDATSLDQTSHSTEAPNGSPHQTGEQADGSAQGGHANADQQQGSATEGTNAGAGSSQESSTANEQTNGAGDPLASSK